MKKSIQDIKALSKAGKRLNLVIDVCDYTFLELMDLAKITDLLSWHITLKNSTKLSNQELHELLINADQGALTLDFTTVEME
jgi:hypothetical protein